MQATSPPPPPPPHAPVPHFSPSPPSVSIAEGLSGLAAGGPGAWQRLVDALAHLAVNLLMAAAIFAFTLWAARWAAGMATLAAARIHRRQDSDPTLQTFIGSLVRYAVLIVGMIAVLQQLGVQTTSVIAVLGAASLAIGLALQGGLSNVAAGVMILLLRPYRVGDRVEITGKLGRVRGLDLFMTRLTDLDNRLVFIPNGKAFGDIIVNHSMPEAVRIETEFRIGHDMDVDLALRLLIESAAADPRVVAEPAPWAKLTAVNDGAVTVTLRAWTGPAAFNDTRFDLIRAVKQQFEGAGLSFA